MLYVYSWRDNWAGKNGDEEVARTEEKYLRQKISSLEFMAAPENDIFAQRLKLAKRLLQSEKFMAARDVLEDGEARLTKDSTLSRQAILLKKVELYRLEAICFRNANADLFEYASAKYKKAAELLASADKRDPNTAFEQLSLINDQAVLQYIWANASQSAVERSLHFALAEGLFQKCVSECRFHLNTQVKRTKSEPTDDISDKYKKLAKLSTGNWIELLKDLGRSSEIANISNLIEEGQQQTQTR